MSRINLLGLCGSLRKTSLNAKLMRFVARRYEGADLTEGDLNLPLYDWDIETNDGIPPQIHTLAEQIATADAVLIATPEYNKCHSGVLHNAFDWVSRVDGNPWEGKPVAIVSATAGRTGGEAAQHTLRHALTIFRPRIALARPVLISGAGKEFDDDGNLLNERYVAAVTALVEALQAEVEISSKF